MHPVEFTCTESMPLSPGAIAELVARVERWPDFEGYGPIPGIAEAVYETRTAGMTGSRIRVRNRDGSSHVEEVLEWLPDERLSMRIDSFSSPLARIADHFIEEWRFLPERDRTRVHRTFSLHPRRRAARPLLRLVGALLRRAVARHLRAMRQAAEPARQRSAAPPFGALLAVSLSACAPAARTTAEPQPHPADTVPAAAAAAAARADSVRASYSRADVVFMTGMIHHHVQALVMARMVPTRASSRQLQVLAGRIINSQSDEIALMQRWLRDRGEAVPEPESMDPSVHGHGHGATMPGMLTARQLAELEAARGADFDRLFLTYMIQHHQGALTMVNELFSTHGAAQGDDVFVLASGIAADQESEIDRMRSMLRELVFDNDES